MGEAFTTTALRELGHLYRGHPLTEFCRMAADHIDRLTSALEHAQCELDQWSRVYKWRVEKPAAAADVCSIPESAFPETGTKAAGMGWKHEFISDYELSGPRDCQSGAAERMAHDVMDIAPQRTAQAIDTSTDHLRAEFPQRAEKAQRTMADLYGPAYALDLARLK